MRTVKGIHTFWKDHTTQSTTYSPCSRQMKPFPSLCKKIKAFMEEKRDENNPFSPILTQFTRKTVAIKRIRERSQKRSKSRKLDLGSCAPSKVKRPIFTWSPLPLTKTTTTTTMASNPQTATSNPPVISTASTSCKNEEHPAHFAFFKLHPLHL